MTEKDTKSLSTNAWSEGDENVLADRLAQIHRRFKIGAKSAAENTVRWLKGLRNQQPLNIPAPQPVVRGDMVLTQLAKSDPRGIFAGRYVGCCQYPQGWAAVCAWHGHESPNGAFWVVEMYKSIVAVAWVWRHEHVLVVDSVEIKRTKEDREIISGHVIREMYVQAAKNVVGQKGIKVVYAGCGRCNSWPSRHKIQRLFPSPAPYEYQDLDDKVYEGDDSRWIHVIASLPASKVDT